MRHQDLTINHRLESWVFANDAARTAAGAYVSDDIGRIAYQTDTTQYWRLTATTPAWQLIPGIVPTGGSAGQILTKNSGTNYDATWRSGYVAVGGPASPTGTTSTTGVMMGLNGTFTPSSTGRVLLCISGQASNNTANGIWQITGYYGTGANPGNGVAPPGGSVNWGPTLAAKQVTGGYGVTFTLIEPRTGFTLGTIYWFDAAIWASGGGTSSIVGVKLFALEF